MGNHWHLGRLGENNEGTEWLGALAVQPARAITPSPQCGGHIHQGRFKSFPIQDIAHLWTVLRYVEANPLRAKLVRRAEEWPWSSLSVDPLHAGLIELARPKLTAWPRDASWLEAVNTPLPEARLDLLRRSVVRGTPFGLPEWVGQLVVQAGMESTLRPRGRPRKLVPEE